MATASKQTAPFSSTEMALLNVYSAPVKQHFYSTFISRATLFNLICAALCVILPLVISFASNGFWVKTKLHREKPDIEFKHKGLLVLDTSSGNSVIWSTFSGFSGFLKNLRYPSISNHELDTDDDGKFDQLELALEVPLESNEFMHTVSFYLVFQYKLQDVTELPMESLGIVHYSSGLPLRSLSFIGDLKFTQNEPLSFGSRDSRYNVPIFPEDSEDLFDLGEILKNYSRREYFTTIENSYFIPRTSPIPEPSFQLNVTLNYPAELIVYSPGFWETLKWGWIQYVSFFVIFYEITQCVRKFVFTRQIVPTWREKINKIHVD